MRCELCDVLPLLLLLQLDERRLDVHVVVSFAHTQTVLARIQTSLQLVLLLRQLSINKYM